MKSPRPPNWCPKRDSYKSQLQQHYTSLTIQLSRRYIDQGRPYPYLPPRMHLAPESGEQLPPGRILDHLQAVGEAVKQCMHGGPVDFR